jgi:hypothetical protein
MYEVLTLDDLYKLHHDLFTDATAAHKQMIDGGKPVIPVFSDEWQRLTQIHQTLLEVMTSIDDEICRRYAENHAEA